MLPGTTRYAAEVDWICQSVLGLVVIEIIRTVRGFFWELLNRFSFRADCCAGARFQGSGGAGARATAANTPAVHALIGRLCDGPAVGPAREQTVLFHDFARERRFAAHAVAAPSSGRAAL